MSSPAPFAARSVHLVAPRRLRHGTGGERALTARGVVVHVLGCMDFGAAERLTAGLVRVCDARHPGPVVLDLSRVTFMDGEGLRSLLVLRERLSLRK